MHEGAFWSFHIYIYIYIYMNSISWGHFHRLSLLNWIFNLKSCWCVYNAWKVLVHFKRYMRRFLLTEISLQPYHWMCHHVLFMVVRLVLAEMERFIALGLFFLFFPLPLKITGLSSLVNYFNFSPYFFILYFFSWSFYKSFICFQFHHLILIYPILFFHFNPYSFDF